MTTEIEELKADLESKAEQLRIANRNQEKLMSKV